jgi:hypothetical protein
MAGKQWRTEMSGFKWIEPTSSRGSNPDSSHLVSITVSPASRDNRSDMRLAIAIYPAGLKLTRWIKGDKVVVGYDAESNMLAIKRVANNGYALSNNGGSKKSNSVRTSVPAPAGLPEMRIYRPTQSDVQLIDGMLVISLPKIGTDAP